MPDSRTLAMLLHVYSRTLAMSLHVYSRTLARYQCILLVEGSAYNCCDLPWIACSSSEGMCQWTAKGSGEGHSRLPLPGAASVRIRRSSCGPPVAGGPQVC